MPSLKHQVTPIESYEPAIEFRDLPQSAVLDGRNFIFDSKGPKSGFTSRVLTPFEMNANGDVQSLTVENRSFVFTGDSILTWRRSAPFMWELLLGFSTPLSASSRDPWSGIFLAGRVYFAHPIRGMFSADYDGESDQLYLRPETNLTIPGLIAEIKGMAIVRGRAILVNDEMIQWSNTGDMSDLTPGLSGAGFQRLDELVEGTFTGLAAFQDSFVVWTTGGAVIAEFIDGDFVWNFYPAETRERPLNSRCHVRLKDGRQMILTGHGLRLVSAGARTEEFTPAFSEFLRRYLMPESGQFTSHQFWRLDYDDLRGVVYVSESNSGDSYWRTFVYVPTLQRFGLFSEKHHGFAQCSEDSFGYLTAEGLARYFTEGYVSEGEPLNEWGLNRHIPRSQKQMRTPSSTAVSRAYVPMDKLVMTPFQPSMAGWYEDGSNIPASGAIIGLDSWVEIGYVKPQELQGNVADAVEIQEMQVSNIRAVPGFPMDFRSAHRQDLLYIEDEDWNSPPIINDMPIYLDMNLEIGDPIDYLTYSPNGVMDFNTYWAPDVSFSDDGDEDWNLMTGDEDWGGLTSGLSPYDYNLSWLASLDGITFDLVKPDMARFDIAGQVWTGITSGTFHRIRLEAIEPMQFFHANHINVTLQYNGKLT